MDAIEWAKVERNSIFDIEPFLGLDWRSRGGVGFSCRFTD